MLITKINYLDPILIAEKFAQETGFVFLDSQHRIEEEAYSFIGLDPFLTLNSKNSCVQLGLQTVYGNPFTILKEQLQKYQLAPTQHLSPLKNGIIGYFGYDLCHHLEKLPKNKDDLEFPDLALGFYDLMMGFNKVAKEAWIFASGLPEQEKDKQKKRAYERTQWLINLLDKKQSPLPKFKNPSIELKSNFTKNEYISAVKKIIDYIYAGDIFQANLSQRFQGQLPKNFIAFDLYKRLAHINPAPFASFLNFGDTILISASPESFLKLKNRTVETSPIKGTRPRSKNINEDNLLKNELSQSSKDRAENIMIVDLLRNDLSKVCEKVNVNKLCEVQSFATVHHLVSKISGQLKWGENAISLLEATFPGGSITGAPKIRAMEIITELEPTQRGPYCGCIGYIDFNGNMETAITIRTYAIKNNTITFQTGGGITADSDPNVEYEETLTKAYALAKALQP